MQNHIPDEQTVAILKSILDRISYPDSNTSGLAYICENLVPILDQSGVSWTFRTDRLPTLSLRHESLYIRLLGFSAQFHSPEYCITM